MACARHTRTTALTLTLLLPPLPLPGHRDYELQFAAEFGLPFDTVLAYQYPWDAYYDGSWHATILPGLLAQLRAGDVE